MSRRRALSMAWWDKWPLEFGTLFAGLPAEYEDFAHNIRVVGKALVCTGAVEVNDVGMRTVTVIFPGRPSRVRPIVMADGSERSRHRFHSYRISALCMYYAGDPDAMQWTLRDRLTGLLDLTRVHLLKEAWWRLTDEWPSPEVHRDPDERLRATTKGGGSSTRGRSRRLRYERRRCWCGGELRYARCHGGIAAAHERQVLGLPSAP